MNAVRGHVSYGPDFFQKEISNYTRWDFAWGREVGQNSLDAGAKNIAVDVCRDGDGCEVIWTDDGFGMTLEILIGKFLTLGESHKMFQVCKNCGQNHTKMVKACASCGWKPTGGFGWAKTLILFAQNRYVIRTKDIVLTGCGGDYSYTTENPLVEGCIVEVNLPASADTIRQNIVDWAKWTDTKGCNITLDGFPLSTFKDMEVKGEKKMAGLDWAKLKVIKSPKDATKRIYYRINGQMMSNERAGTGVKDNLVIDIVGDSTKYFTANRDSVKWCYRDDISTFLQNLYRDPKAVTRVEKPKRLIMRGGKGMLEIGVTEEDKAKKIQFYLDNPDALAAALDNRKNEGGVVHDGFTTIVVNETNKTIPTKWMPGMWNKHASRLMTRWCGLILLVGDCASYKGNITPGWLFSSDTIAQWNHGDKSMTLMPVEMDIKTGKMVNKFKFDSAGFHRMLISCVHEYCHALGYKYHDERFLMCFERLMTTVIDRWADFKKLRAGT